MKKWLLVMVLGFMALPVFSSTEPKDDIHVSMLENKDGSHALAGGFTIQASTVVAWNVLTNYDGMANFISCIKGSRCVEEKNNSRFIEQVMVGRAGLFRKRIYLLLEVDETSPLTIYFKDTAKKSFKSYVGSWVITDLKDRIRVDYKLEAKADFFAPDFIAVKAFKNSVKMLLTEVHDEIAARQRESN